MDSKTQLSVNSQFELERFRRQISNASREQAVDIAYETYRLFLLNREMMVELIKEHANGNRPRLDG